MSHYIVLDLEWNQDPTGRGPSGDKLPFEIIEIGAVKLDENLRIISEFRRLILPRVYRQLHYKIAEVTHLTMADLLAEGKKFEDAVEEFLDWCGEDYYFCTWGTMDLTELQRNMVYHGLELPFPLPFLYYDLQKIYALLKEDRAKESLDTAVEQLEIPVEEKRRFHCAADDAYYTALVMKKMGFARKSEYLSVDYYRLPEYDEEFCLRFPDYDKYVSAPYEEKEEVLDDGKLTEMLCSVCHRPLRKKIRWFSSNQKYYYCLAYCPVHGYVRGKIRIKKAEDGELFAVKTVKLADETSIQKILSKKEEMKRKRAERNSRGRAARAANRKEDPGQKR